ncbi:MAG TPA: PaaI family thioesterase [Phenylobacterium sp.]|nr:PaaI family thioesterase [Phenylobacterium sp.]
MSAALFEASPYARFLGMRLEGEGEARHAVLPFAPHLIGNAMLPAIHGGVLGGFLEITALAKLSQARPGERLAKPVDINIEYFRPAGPRDTFARAVIRRAGRRIANVRVEAWQEGPEKPVAALHGHFLLRVEEGS